MCRRDLLIPCELSCRTFDFAESTATSGAHRRLEVESKLNEAAALSKSLTQGASDDAVQVYDFHAQAAYDGATKDLQVDSLVEEVR